MTALSKDKRSKAEETAATEADAKATSSDLTARQEALIINEVQLILAEKRTSLAAMRTGIAVLVLPLSVLSVLISTSKYYDIEQVLPLLLPLLILCLALIVFGAYLIVRSLARIHHHDRMTLNLKKKHSRLAQFID